MNINMKKKDIKEMKKRIKVLGVGGGGGNEVKKMINEGMRGVDLVVEKKEEKDLKMQK